MRGKFHVKLNNGERPIANKYREGKMQRTLKRELKVLEIVKREAFGISTCTWLNQTNIIYWWWFIEQFRLSICYCPVNNIGSILIRTGQHPWKKREMDFDKVTGCCP